MMAQCVTHPMLPVEKLDDSRAMEDMQGMARFLCEYDIFDLDKQKIVDFRLKAWADQFFTLRTGILADEYYEETHNDNRVIPTGVGTFTHFEFRRQSAA